MSAYESPDIRAPWIWHPEVRTHPNTFLFFRKSFVLNGNIESGASGWVTADSRYILYLNGRRIGRGPAPCDPRVWEVDPVDFGDLLQPGKNALAALVLHYGQGDGTYVPAPPGFLFQATIPTSEGEVLVESGADWRVQRAACFNPANPRRSFIRSLQEGYDARLYPEGWETLAFDDSNWPRAVTTGSTTGKPTVSAVDMPAATREQLRLIARPIPPLEETDILQAKPSGAESLRWKLPAEEHFQRYTPGACERAEGPDGNGRAWTFDLGRETVGYPFVRFRAPAGATVYFLFTETRREDSPLLPLVPWYGTWARIVAREGETEFRCFEWESARFLQLAVEGDVEVEVLEAGLVLRRYPFERQPDLRTDDEAVNKVIAGCVASALGTFQDSMVDNVVRERQQYTADVGECKRTAYLAFGETRQPERMLRTWALGQNAEGWFPDCWPAWDRMHRLWEKHLGICNWSPLIDHAMSFVQEVETHVRFTGDLDLAADLYPRLTRFTEWLFGQRGLDGLLPADGYTWCSVWMDHDGWHSQEDKKAALNLFFVHMLRVSLRRLAEWLGEDGDAINYRSEAEDIARAVADQFWSDEHHAFVDNLPRLERNGGPRMHDRTLAMGLLAGVVPDESLPDYIQHLAQPGPEVGLSFPANAHWRYWALAEAARAEVIVDELRSRWANMDALRENGVISEMWEVGPNEVRLQNVTDPLYVLYGEILGIEPLEPGWRAFRVRPQLGGLKRIQATIPTPRGAFRMEVSADGGGTRLAMDSLPEATIELVTPADAGPRATEGRLREDRAEARGLWTSTRVEPSGTGRLELTF